MVGLTTNSSGTTPSRMHRAAAARRALDDADKEFRVLHPMKVDSAAGSLKLAGSVTEGTNLTLLKGEVTPLSTNPTESLRRRAWSSQGALGAFMILCGGLVMAWTRNKRSLRGPRGRRRQARSPRHVCVRRAGANCKRGCTGTSCFGVLMFSNKLPGGQQVPGPLGALLFFFGSFITDFQIIHPPRPVRAPAPLRSPPLLGGVAAAPEVRPALADERRVVVLG